METQTYKRRDRFDRRPRTKDGKRINSVPTPRDLNQIYPLLLTYRVLTTEDIHAFVGGDYQSLAKHLSRQALAPHFYLRVVAASHSKRMAGFNPFVFELGPGAEAELKERHYHVPERSPVRYVDHKLLECKFESSIHLGTIKNPSIQRIWWDQIKEDLPAKTKKLNDPLKIPVFGDFFVRPDGRPFVLTYDGHDMGRFCVFEADCDTESKDSDYTNSIRFKLEAYLYILTEKIHLSHFGAETFEVFFITTNPESERAILALLEKIILDKKLPKSLARHIHVSHTRLYTWFEEKREPAGDHMMTRPWKRAFGLPEFYLNQPEEA